MFWLLLLGSCNHYKKNARHGTVPDSNIERGQMLAATYCQSCHLLPDPSLLDANSWEAGVLPAMGPRLGIFNFGFQKYPSFKNDRNVDKDYYPSKPMVSMQDWQYILDYYTSLAPDTLPAQQRKENILQAKDLFEPRWPQNESRIPNTCFVKIDTTQLPRQLLLSDVVNKNLYWLDAQLKPTDSIKSLAAVVDAEINAQEILTCNIGNINPNNAKLGSLSRIAVGNNRQPMPDTNFNVQQLARPVQVSSADFNKDGKADLLVCEFGNLAGALSWMENKGNQQYERHVIRAFPGAIKAYVRDVNKDGLPDIWALFAQGEEGIFLFTNKGNGQFESKEVLRFPSVYGSSYFEMADFNKDGFPDILYTCGDNADFSPVLKPYHGVYIFLNDGNNHFTQKYFFPMHGCFKAMASDFDGDGDLDIAAISFFSDYATHPEESFIYLENKGKLDFQPYTIPGTQLGRWLTMDLGDLDGDGSPDIVLGNFSSAPLKGSPPPEWKKSGSVVFLKNIIKKNKRKP
jgi:hypothetical protein